MSEKTMDLFTSCRECFFAIKQDGQQVGCKLGRLDKYRTKGITEFEEGFYNIKTICNAHRTGEWAEKYDNPEEIVRQQIQFRYDAIIHCIDNNDFKGINRTIKSVISQNIKPNSVIVLIKNKKCDLKKLYDDISTIINNTIPFRLISIVDESLNWSSCLDSAVKKCISQYYGVFEAGNKAPEKLTSLIDDLINNKLHPVSLVEFDNGFIIQTLLHKVFNGNQTELLTEKVKKAAKEQNVEKMIVNLTKDKS